MGIARPQLGDEHMKTIPRQSRKLSPTPLPTSSSPNPSSGSSSTAMSATEAERIPVATAKLPTYELDQNGGPIIPPPPPRLMKDSFTMVLYYYTIFPLFLPLIKIFGNAKLPWKDLLLLFRIAFQARSKPVNGLPEFQNHQLLKQLYQTASAQHYVQQKSLEWQSSEGYCAPATVRCVLGSYPCIDKKRLPKQSFKESSPENVCNLIHEIINDGAVTSTNSTDNSNDNDNTNVNMATEIIRGDTVTYDEFVSTIRQATSGSSDTKRIMLNFHRPPLFGTPKSPWSHPLSFIVYSVLAGHFSPILGLIENPSENEGNNPLVGIWDVNHRYGGAYLVPAKRLYTSVTARDFWSGKSRALVVVTKL